MNTDKDFSECLNELMRAADLKNSKLAKAINVDASLIYKWLNNKSIPPYNSQHIDLIVNQVIKNTNNSYQSKNINDFIKKNLKGCSEITEKNKLELLKKLLIESQGCSIEKKKRTKKLSMSAPNTKAYTIESKLNINTSAPSLISQSTSQDTITDLHIITGQESVLNSILQLLEAASTINIIPTEPIMLTFLTEMNKLSHYPNFNKRWKEALCKLTRKGWNIIYLVHINSNDNRNFKIIEDMLIPISTGRYQVYYKSGNDCSLPFEIVFVPQVGSLFSISSVDKHQIDSAFLTKSEEALNVTRGYFYQLLASSTPLLKSYFSNRNMGFLNFYSETEDILGNRYTLIRELSTLSIPSELYEQYLKRINLKDEEIANELIFHRQRIKTFEFQAKHYKFRDIISDTCIDSLIKKKRYSYLDKNYACNNIVLTNDDIIKHLANIIKLLENYENYEIGLLNKRLLRSLPITNWMVKENSSVGLISYDSENLDFSINEPISQTQRGFKVSQPNIIKAFENYFDNLWNQIQPNKKDIISQFKSYISLLSSN